jgi:hypothetical protein
MTSVNAIRFRTNRIVTSEGHLTRGAHLRMIAKDFASGSWDYVNAIQKRPFFLFNSLS